MLPHYSGSGMTDYMLMASERHKHLIEEAQRRREVIAACSMGMQRPMRWCRLRYRMRHRVGDLLVHMGQRLKMDATDTVWG